MKRLIKSSKKEQGQSMVELALTMTILLILLAGTIDLGRAFFTWLQMRDAAQEGASYGSICPVASKISPRVQANLDPIYSYTISYNIPSPVAPGDTIIVTVRTSIPLTMPFLGAVLGSQTIPIRATINDTILTTTCP